MLIIIVAVVVTILMFRTLARLAGFLTKVAVSFLAIGATLWASLWTIDAGEQFLRKMHSTITFAAAHGAETAFFAAAGILAIAGVLLALYGLRTAWQRMRCWLGPVLADLRMQRAAYRLRQSQRTVSVRSLAQSAGVNQEDALRWLTLHPAEMPAL